MNMFSYQARLEQAFASAPVLSVDDHSRIVLMSDCHRGNGTMADDFAKNQSICHAALSFYHRLGYTYIELGDGDAAALGAPPPREVVGVGPDFPDELARRVKGAGNGEGSLVHVGFLVCRLGSGLCRCFCLCFS